MNAAAGCTSLSGAGTRLRLDHRLIGRLVPDIAERDVYVCGPEGFTNRILARRAAPRSRRRRHPQRVLRVLNHDRTQPFPSPGDHRMRRMPIVVAGTAAGLAAVLGFHTETMGTSLLSGLSGASGTAKTPAGASSCRERQPRRPRQPPRRQPARPPAPPRPRRPPPPAPVPPSAPTSSTATGSWSSR